MAGLVGIRFNTFTCSNGVVNSTTGMCQWSFSWSGCKNTSTYTTNMTSGGGSAWYSAGAICTTNGTLVIKIPLIASPNSSNTFNGTITVTEFQQG